MSDSLHVVCPQCNATNRVVEERLEDGAKCGGCKQPLFAGSVLELDQQSFERHLAKSDLPLIVDFWAPWCAPCKMMAPAYERAAATLEPRVRLAKLNTEAEPAVASRFGIRGIPTLIAFKNGREIARQSGALDVTGVVSWVQSQVQNADRGA